MSFRISKHAREEIARRGIELAEVESVLVTPGQIVQEHGGIVCYQSPVVQDGKRYLLRVMVNDSVDPKVVVTIYKTSKLNKYWQP